MDFGDWIAEALSTVRADCPKAHDALVAALDGLEVALTVDRDPTVVVRGHQGALELDSPAECGDPGVDLRTTRSTVLDLVHGRDTLVRAVVSDRLRLVGPVDALCRFDAALYAFLAGAVRSPRFVPMLTRFTEEADGETQR